MNFHGRNADGRRTTRPLATIGLALAVTLTGVPAADALVRQASPSSADTTGTCLLTPCRIDRAERWAAAPRRVRRGV